VPERARLPLRWLRRLFAAADADALRYQTRLLGAWSPGMRRRGGWRPGALLWFAAAVSAAALCVEMYAGLLHGGHGRDAVPWLVAYGVALLAPLLYYGLVVRFGEWQARSQDHRVFAEALRVQILWALAGLPVAVPDNLGKHADALGWVRLALRGPALWAAAAAFTMQGPATEVLCTSLLRDPREFAERTGREGARAATWMQRGARVSVTVLILVFFAQFGLHVWLGEPSHWTVKTVPLALGVLPALGSFFVITAEGRAYEVHVRASAQLKAVYTRALEQAGTLRPDDAVGWRSLALAVGREALADGVTWLEMIRERSVASRTG
jgi:hypothetical protein